MICLILGDVGTGKTTLVRKLIKTLSDKKDFITRIILDPSASSEHAFLKTLSDVFGLNPGFRSTANYKKVLENFLFEEGVVNNKTILLFVDEAQTLSMDAMEVLRTLLNYETNENKLIQIVLFGQKELLPKISRMPNLWDRLALKYIINPLKVNEIKELISFRLHQAGYEPRFSLFTDTAIDAIYQHTHGYLRRTTLLCHDALEYLVMHDKEVMMVDREVIETLIQQEVKPMMFEFNFALPRIVNAA